MRVKVRVSVTIPHPGSQSVTERPNAWVPGGSTVSVIRVQVRLIKVAVTVRVGNRVTCKG